MAKTSETTESAAKKSRLSLETVAEMAANPPVLRWLVEGVLVKGQPMVVGGPPKSLKTSLTLDLAVSLATATPFLGKFAVPTKRRVAVFSGESGRATVNETVLRILRAKGEEPEDCALHCGFDLPRLAVEEDRDELRQLLKDNEVEVVIVDPLYLCLLAGSKALSAASLFDVGAVLGAAAKTCARAGATLVLVHHTTKASSAKSGATTLADLSFAGVGEFARQWMLLSRATEYAPGTGKHDLTLSIGGSAGHSSQWRVRIEEGAAGSKNRKWEVDVKLDQPHEAVRAGSTKRPTGSFVGMKDA